VSASEGPRVDYVLPLADERAALAVAGGKGASLARLVRAGLPVPPGFHVTTAAYRQFVAENGLHERILQALEAVAAITTPAWTPLFALASAVVTDVGGPLSHSSIVAREYAIPAVLGTGVATHRIQSGQRVMADGSRGEVTLLP
jgi:phosphoenolpyruvate synthase/pyruvate phosphate dikinase